MYYYIRHKLGLVGLTTFKCLGYVYYYGHIADFSLSCHVQF